MSIVKMDRIQITGISSEKEQVLTALMNLGAVEISDIRNEEIRRLIPDDMASENKEAKAALFERNVRSLRETMAIMKQAIDLSDEYFHEKKSMFASKRKVTAARFTQTVKQSDIIMEEAKVLLEISSKISTLNARIFRLSILKDQLRPWRAVPIRLDETQTTDTDILLGTVPGESEFHQIRRLLEENAPESIIEIVYQGRDEIGISITVWNGRRQDLRFILKSVKFTPLHVPDMQGTCIELYEGYTGEIERLSQEIEQIRIRLSKMSESKEQFEMIYDHALIGLRRILSEAKAFQTEYTYTLYGFAPSHLAASIEKALTGSFIVAFSAQPVDRQEDYPILLKNHPLVKPYEVVTEMFSTPSSRDIDPNPLMAPFFLFFFSLMLSDSGYGLILAAGCAFLIWKMKVTGNTRSMCLFLFHGGLASILWGLLFGGFFGDIVTAITNGSYTFPSIWFNPIENPTKLMIWSMIFGTIHLLAGMGAKGMLLIMSGKIKDAVFDILPWYLVILGLGATLSGMMLSYPVIAQIGKYMAITGVAVIILFAGRASSNPVVRIFKGLSELYGITGYFSDILSYTRILALSLATSVIAMVVNLLGGIAGSGLFGMVLFVVVGLVGHGMNLAISTLGCYVHTSRLQYVEFFGKFYEGGGRAFDPLMIQTEYIRIVSL